MRLKTWLPAMALCAAVSAGSARAAVTEDSFVLRNTGDLVDLCAATQSDPLYTAAMNFCEGFIVGVFRVLQVQETASRSRHMFCAPNPMPSRNEGVASFVQWAKEDTSRLALSPPDGVAAFLSQKLPCPGKR